MIGLSKSSLETFKSCPKCFWLEKIQKLKRPEGIKASIMNGIDDMMKRSSDYFVANQQPMPYLHELPGARPFQDRERMKKFMNWRTFQATVQAGRHQALIWGQVDDLIQWDDGRVSAWDYKSNGKEREWEAYTAQYNSLQGDMYDILLPVQGLVTTGVAYFTYTWPVLDIETGIVVFTHKTVSIETNAGRALKVISDAMDCLEGPEPEPDLTCDYCRFALDRAPVVSAAAQVEQMTKPAKKAKAVRS